MCLYWAITGPRFLSPARHLLAVALTRQSPAANAMWQCWDYNIWPILPGINAITAPRPLRWATPELRYRERSGNWEGGQKKKREEGERSDRWMNLRKWEKQFSASKRPVQLWREGINIWQSHGKDEAFLSDFMASQEDAFKEELWFIVVCQVNHSLNNNVEICHPHH